MHRSAHSALTFSTPRSQTMFKQSYATYIEQPGRPPGLDVLLAEIRERK